MIDCTGLLVVPPKR